MIGHLEEQVERHLKQGQRWVNVWNFRNVDGQVNDKARGDKLRDVR